MATRRITSNIARSDNLGNIIHKEFTDKNYVTGQNGNTKISVEKFPTVPPDVVCMLCGGVMRNPIKAVDGASYCRICYLSKQEFTSSDMIPIFEKDEELENKIATLICYCNYRKLGCGWKNEIRLLDQHMNECEMIPVQCIHCDMVYLRRDESEHRDLCTFETCICGLVFYRSERKKHRIECDLYITCANCQDQVAHTNFENHAKNCKNMFCKSCKEVIDHQKMFTHAKNHIIEQGISGADHLKDMIEEIKTAQNTANVCKITTLRLECEINQLKNEVSQLTQVGRGRTDGCLVWIIENVVKKHEIAQQNQIPLYSPHFYSHENGYKMGVKLYLNGEGDANGEYISLFFCIYKGPYDDILQWPFLQKVAIQILAFGDVETITEVFTPEKTSSSFAKPREAHNIPSGFKRFAKQDIFKKQAFVKSGNLYIKIATDITNLQHP
ncbi:TNF receptor-associated factor 2 [Oopsacas minuta]|uniref:TNF receptor-associated factor 2 n=1 Tax=Oopsacas minuta TaxID=111878 RepID=A0AAV7JWE2_9METZ|nr:TNF receptor-associated factor 2 [Oopsacas minuta]